MPDGVGHLPQSNASAFLHIVGTAEQTQIDTRRILRKQGEVRSLWSDLCAEGIRLSRPNGSYAESDDID